MAPALSKPWFPVETWRGHVISQRGRSFRVGDFRFKSLRDARAFIDGDEAQRARAVRQLAAKALKDFARPDDSPDDGQSGSLELPESRMGEIKTAKAIPIASPDDDLGEIGRCLTCGAAVHGFTCNGDVVAVRPEADREDYWAACTNLACENAYGEGYLQDWPDWVEEAKP